MKTTKQIAEEFEEKCLFINNKNYTNNCDKKWYSEEEVKYIIAHTINYTCNFVMERFNLGNKSEVNKNE